MSAEAHTVIPAAPSTQRGCPLHLGVWGKQNSVVYGNGLFVYARNVEKPLEVKAVHRNKNPVTAVRVCPSQAYCASGDKEGNVIVWALDNPQNTVKLETRVTGGPIRDISFTGDNQRMVAVGEGRDQFGAAVLVDGGSSVGEIKGHTKNILSCDMKLERPFKAVTASEDQEVNFYKGPPFKFEHTLKHHSNIVNCVRYSPSGGHFITVSSDKTMLLYDGTTGEKVGDFPCDHTGSVYSVAWHSSGKKLMTASADKSVKLWDAEGKKCLKTIPMRDKTVDYMQLGCVFVGDKMVSVSFNGDVNVMDEAGSVTVLRGHGKPVTALAVDGQTVATCSGDPAVLLWEGQCHVPEQSRRPAFKKMHGSVISGAVISDRKLFTCSMDDTIAVTPLDSAELSLLPAKLSGGPNGIVVADGHLVVTTNKGVWVLDKEGNEKSKLSTSYTPTCCASNGNVVAVGAKEKKFVLYALKGGKLEEIKTAEEHKAPVTAVAWSHDGSRLATGDGQREVMLWEFAGSDLKMLSGAGDMAYHSQTIKSLAFSPSGKFLVTGSVDTHVFIWDLQTKSRVKVECAHLGGVNCVSWLSDNEIITAGQDSAIRTWTFKP